MGGCLGVFCFIFSCFLRGVFYFLVFLVFLFVFVITFFLYTRFFVFILFFVLFPLRFKVVGLCNGLMGWGIIGRNMSQNRGVNLKSPRSEIGK